MSKKLYVILFLIVFSCFVTFSFLPREKKDLKNSENTDEQKYGELITWEEANKHFPLYTMAEVIDIETGKSLLVQRRGGTYHADVQPLSKEDSAILKEIYNGQWSWRRRAIVVISGGKRIAASMNGKPHGGGKITGNDFAGHFCIHFLNSKVHKSGNVDLAHQMMVWKAAGQSEVLFSKADDREIIELVVTAINEGDAGLLKLGLYFIEGQAEQYTEEFTKKLVNSVAWVELKKNSELRLEEISQSDSEEKKEPQESICNNKRYKITVKITYRGKSSSLTKEGEVSLKRGMNQKRWFLSGEDLEKLLKDENANKARQ